MAGVAVSSRIPVDVLPSLPDSFVGVTAYNVRSTRKDYYREF